VTTPIAGTVLGEILFRASGMLLREPGFLRALGAGILAPVSPFNRAVLGDWTEKPTNPAELQARVGALGLSEHRGAAASWSSGVVPDFGIRLIYGPAGDPDTRLEKPFDHFDLDASYGATGDAIASIVARGVLWGRQYEGAGERGLWGIYLGYDFFTPGTFRVSTTYLGVGASTRFFLSPSVVLDLDAVGAGIPVGAAGRSYVPPGSKRDYHFGAGVQGDVEGRLRLGDRAEIGVGARYYLLYGQGDYAADERVGYYGASALVRIFGPHAIGAEGILLSRRATAVPNDPPPSQDGQLLRVFYAYSPARRIAPVEVPDLGRP
jgi:hypothetical protein